MPPPKLPPKPVKSSPRLIAKRGVLGFEEKKESEHDGVIDFICRRKFGTSHKWFGNRNLQKESPLEISGKRYYPDLIGLKRGSNEPSVVAEVETDKGLTKRETAQWRKYAGFGLDFLLFVPFDSIEKAKRLCLENDVSCSIYSYQTVQDWLGRKTLDLKKQFDV